MFILRNDLKSWQREKEQPATEWGRDVKFLIKYISVQGQKN